MINVNMLSANPLKLLFVFRSKYAVSFFLSVPFFRSETVCRSRVAGCCLFCIVCQSAVYKYMNAGHYTNTHRDMHIHINIHVYIACGVCRCQASKQLSSCVSNSCLLLCDTTQHVRVCCCDSLCVCECVVRYFIKCTRCVTALPIGSFAASQ